MADPKWKADEDDSSVHACQIDDAECTEDEHYFVMRSSRLLKVTLLAHLSCTQDITKHVISAVEPLIVN